MFGSTKPSVRVYLGESDHGIESMSLDQGVEGKRPDFTLTVPQNFVFPTTGGDIYFLARTRSGSEFRCGGGQVSLSSGGRYNFVPFGWNRQGAIARLASDLGFRLVPVELAAYGPQIPASYTPEGKGLYDKVIDGSKALFLRLLERQSQAVALANNQSHGG